MRCENPTTNYESYIPCGTCAACTANNRATPRPAETPPKERFMKTSLRLVAPIIALLMLFGGSVPAADKTLTVADALSMLQAFRNLDGRIVVVKQNGVDTPVQMPWEFGSGTLRLRIARNVTALAAIEKAVEESRQNIVKEIIKGMPVGKDGPPTSVVPGTPEFDNFSKQIADMLKQPAQVTLSRIKVGELKLDKNEIPVTALSALEPILDE